METNHDVEYRNENKKWRWLKVWNQMIKREKI